MTEAERDLLREHIEDLETLAYLCDRVRDPNRRDAHYVVARIDNSDFGAVVSLLRKLVARSSR